MRATSGTPPCFWRACGASPVSQNDLAGDPCCLAVCVALSEDDAARNAAAGCAVQPSMTPKPVDHPPNRQPGLAQDWGDQRQKAIPRVCSLTPEWPCELDFEVGENRRRRR